MNQLITSQVLRKGTCPWPRDYSLQAHAKISLNRSDTALQRSGSLSISNQTLPTLSIFLLWRGMGLVVLSLWTTRWGPEARSSIYLLAHDHVAQKLLTKKFLFTLASFLRLFPWKSSGTHRPSSPMSAWFLDSTWTSFFFLRGRCKMVRRGAMKLCHIPGLNTMSIFLAIQELTLDRIIILLWRWIPPVLSSHKVKGNWSKHSQPPPINRST